MEKKPARKPCKPKAAPAEMAAPETKPARKACKPKAAPAEMAVPETKPARKPCKSKTMTPSLEMNAPLEGKEKVKKAPVKK